jgi:hypothetical protein
MKFFVAKVDTKKVRFEDGQAVLSPLRFHYDSKTFSLPIRLGLLNSAGEQDLIVHILAKRQRYEVANYENVTIPTNLDVSDDTRGQFGEFYTSLFAKVLAKNKRSVVTEYSWDAGSCDPCPTPALRPDELATLGADVIASDESDDVAPPSPPGLRPRPGSAPGRMPAASRRPMMPPGRRWRPRTSFVLTRLHARYEKEALGDDLVFKEAPPIGGGREVRGADGELEQGTVQSGTNNFQARYAIRHPWTGPIECENPVRGRWGGPPSGVQRPSGPQAAAELGFKRRKEVKLANFLKKDLGELGVSAAKPDPTPAPKAEAPADTKPPEKPKSSSCDACALRPQPDNSEAWLLGLLLAVATAGLGRRRTR